MKNEEDGEVATETTASQDCNSNSALCKNDASPEDEDERERKTKEKYFVGEKYYLFRYYLVVNAVLLFCYLLNLNKNFATKCQ